MNCECKKKNCPVHLGGACCHRAVIHAPENLCSACADPFHTGRLRIFEVAPAPASGRVVAVGCIVIDNGVEVARARSKTYAKRIARALNNHVPNSEGV